MAFFTVLSRAVTGPGGKRYSRGQSFECDSTAEMQLITDLYTSGQIEWGFSAKQVIQLDAMMKAYQRRTGKARVDATTMLTFSFMVADPQLGKE